MARPTEFDIDHALDRAMRVFWKHGYHGTSVADLMKAAGFKNKACTALSATSTLCL